MFLQNNGVKTTFQNVSRFIKSIDTNNIYKSKKNETNDVIKSLKNHTILPKLEKVGKDLDLKETPSWAN